MKSSFAECFVSRPVICLLLLLAVVGSSTPIKNSSPWCNVTVQSRSLYIPCDVNLTRCDERVQRLSLFSPPVNNLEVSVEMDKEWSDEYLSSLATMRWKLPDCSDSLTGFLVHIQTLDGLSNKCYLLSNPCTDAKDDPEFEFYLPLEPDNYSVRVHSYVESSLVHGSPYTVPRRTLIIKKRQKEFRNSPAYWITDFVVFSNSCSSSITVTFELGPDAYNFSVYSVSLEKRPLEGPWKQLHVMNGQRQGTVLFGNLTSGNYTVVVSPVNIDWRDEKLCRCRCGSANTDSCRPTGDKCPGHGCVDIKSSLVAINNVNESDCYVTTDDPLLPTKITGIAIGCFLATGLISLFVWIFLRPKHIDINIHSLNKQEVFLLYLRDHQLHYNIVHHFLHFLNRHCNCSVRTMHDDEHLISQDPFKYMQSVCDGSSKILLINSDGITNSSPQSMSPDPLDPMVQLFLKYLRSQQIHENVDKVTIARFDYTETNNVAKLINYRQHEYLLMEEVELLVLRIHGFEKRTGRCVHHNRDVQKSFSDSPEGRSLREAMLLMKGATVNDRPNISVDLPAEPSDLTDSEGEGDGQAYADLWERRGDIDVREPVVDVGEPFEEFYVSEEADNVQLLRVQIVPPQSDSSSVDSDGDPQLWSNEFNAHFDLDASQFTDWRT